MLFAPTIAGSQPKPFRLAGTEKLWPKWPTRMCAPLPRDVAAGKLRAPGAGAEPARRRLG